MAGLRVLSLDGGGQLEMTSALLLQEIEARRPGFLANTDVFAGTSAGAMVSLILATHDNPAYLLPETEQLWEKFVHLTMNSVTGMLMGLVGAGAVFTHERLEQYLGQEHLLGDKTLADLKKKVVIPAFQLDAVSERTGARRWQPKLFHNFGDASNPDYAERCLDVALRSGAAPIMFPVVDGFVDGGVVANHPALVAISVILDDWLKQRTGEGATGQSPEHQESKEEVLRDLRVLSIGVGEDQRFVPVKDADWGWFNWVLNPFNPLLAINALLRGDMWAINFECYSILPEGNYHRLNPHYVRHTPIPFMVNTGLIRKTVASEQTQRMVDETIAWIDSHDWMD